MSGEAGRSDPVQELLDWLLDQAFGDPDAVDVFGELCARLVALGVPIQRAYFAWPTLHPLVDAESIFWSPETGATVESYAHDNTRSDQWLRSPMRYIIEHNIGVLRRVLTGPEAQLDFPILEQLARNGFTDYLLLGTRYAIPRVDGAGEPGGILSSFTTRRPTGFSEADLTILQRIQKPFAVASKTMALSRITRNVADTYLGHVAAQRVLAGQIRRGDGEVIEAVVWYSDLRNSTALAEAMDDVAYLQLLNRFFECTAGAALAAGGEVLDFIGDAVLAIFPHDTFGGPAAAAGKACDAIADAAERRRLMLASDASLALDFGIGLDAGRLTFGNIGVPERLAFSVIGPTVNKVARLEKLTKDLGVLALATGAIAETCPARWRPVGARALSGLLEPVELHAWRPPAGTGD